MTRRGFCTGGTGISTVGKWAAWYQACERPWPYGDTTSYEIGAAWLGSAIITPITVSWHTVGMGLGFGVLTVACLFPGRAGLLTRKRGALLLALYMVYVATILTH